VAVALLLGVACGGGGEDNDAGRLAVNGRAEVGAPGEGIDEVRGTATIQFGQRVSVREGTAVIRLSGSGDRQLELRVASNVELGTATDSGSPEVKPILLGGDVLATTGESDLALTAGDVGVVVHGAAKVAMTGQSVVVGSYTGSADVTVAGQTVTVPALRQVVVPAAGPVPAPTPVDYHAGDAWDLRYLGDAVALGTELDARSQGFSAQVGPTDGRSADFFRRLLDPLANEPSFTDGLLVGDRPPGETLVGAAIAVEGTMGPFEERWTEVFAFRDQGASWGLVALDQGVTRAPLVAVVDEGIGKGPTLITKAPPASSDGPAIALPRPSSGNGSGNGNGGNGDPSGTTPPSGSPTTTVPPGPPPDRLGPLNTGIGPIDDLVNALVDTLSGLLRGLGGG
jgi:hypothetical protein